MQVLIRSLEDVADVRRCSIEYYVDLDETIPGTK